jgi:hypothetical protein
LAEKQIGKANPSLLGSIQFESGRLPQPAVLAVAAVAQLHLSYESCATMLLHTDQWDHEDGCAGTTF